MKKKCKVPTQTQTQTKFFNEDITTLDIASSITDLKQLVEDFIIYTKTWSIGETEWYWNVDYSRKSLYVEEKHITQTEFERAIREDILYCFIYNIQSIKQQMEADLENYEETSSFHNESKEMEKKIQRIFKDFKIERFC